MSEEIKTAQDLFDALALPFPADYVEWRVGSTTKDKTKGKPLAYIDARTVMDRLDSACGMDGWQCNYAFNGNLAICNLGIRMPDGSWVWKSDGAGATDYEAEKGMLSDALKRAAVRFGVGRYLYDIKSGWVELNDRQQIPEEVIKKLNELHDKSANSTQWGERAGVIAYRVLLQTVRTFVRQQTDVIDLREANKGMISQMPVAMRRHFEGELDRIGSTGTQEAA